MEIGRIFARDRRGQLDVAAEQRNRGALVNAVVLRGGVTVV
jgi:hypothetical protein